MPKPRSRQNPYIWHLIHRSDDDIKLVLRGRGFPVRTSKPEDLEAAIRKFKEGK